MSVGGGGLLCGVLEGLQRYADQKVDVVAVETQGANAFCQSWEMLQQQAPDAPIQPVTLPAMTSMATSLGALSVTPVALERARQHAGAVRAVTCTDGEAVAACLGLAREHRLLVEPACGAALTTVTSERLLEQESSDSPDGDAASRPRRRPCGFG